MIYCNFGATEASRAIKHLKRLPLLANLYCHRNKTPLRSYQTSGSRGISAQAQLSKFLPSPRPHRSRLSASIAQASSQPQELQGIRTESSPSRLGEFKSSPAAQSDARRRSQGVAAAYIHLPFCKRKCLYCDFPVLALGSTDGTQHAEDNKQASSTRKHVSETACHGSNSLCYPAKCGFIFYPNDILW